MHYNTLKHIRRFKRRYGIGPSMTVLEVGSQNVGVGSVRSEFAGHPYLGIDIAPGPGVDQVVDARGDWDLGRKFDLVVCCNCLEHVKEPWKVFETMSAHVAPGGFLYVTAPFAWHYHRHPVDCYRYGPDGFRHLATACELQTVECYLSHTSIFVPLSYLRDLRTFLQHCHGIAYLAWCILRRKYVSQVDCILVAMKPL